MSQMLKKIDEMNYFELLAWLGIGSSHPGGMPYTRQYLPELELSSNHYVLDAGCGTGATTCYLAKQVGCKVLGIDISEEMIAKAQKRAEREGLGELVEFKACDVTHLPLPSSEFDLVLAESLTVFLDKPRVYKEFYRVLKPGGRLADVEMALVQDLTPEVREEMEQCFGPRTQPLSFEGWVGVLQKAGFIYIGTLLPQYLRPGSNQIVQELRNDWVFIKELVSKIREPGLMARLKSNAEFNQRNQAYFGYGVICGRKPEEFGLFHHLRRVLRG